MNGSNAANEQEVTTTTTRRFANRIEAQSGAAAAAKTKTKQRRFLHFYYYVVAVLVPCSFIVIALAVWWNHSNTTTVLTNIDNPNGFGNNWKAEHDFINYNNVNPPPPTTGFCRELIEGAEFVLNMSKPPSWKLHMIQLVGKYSDPLDTESMERNFRHNSDMLHPHSITSSPIREPTSADLVSNNHPLSPAFWKMDAIRHYCTNGTTDGHSYDLVFFLDGDTCIMDPYARVEFLWAYHANRNIMDHLDHDHRDVSNRLDMLFATDRPGLNSGIFIVNCTSKTAMKTLELWKSVAVALVANGTKVVMPSWYEQNAIHLMMRTKIWVSSNPTLRWNDIVNDYTNEIETYSTESLRKRIRMTTQCALNTYPMEVYNKLKNSEQFVYQPGHFIIHMAAVYTRLKRTYMDLYRNTTKPSIKPVSLRQAAQLYLKYHPFSINRTLGYNEWRRMLDWGHEWPDDEVM